LVEKNSTQITTVTFRYTYLLYATKMNAADLFVHNLVHCWPFQWCRRRI